MGFAAIFSLISPILSDLVKRALPDPVQQADAQNKLQELLNEAQAKAAEIQVAEIQAKESIITTEMNQGGWASQWRSYLMMACISIVAYNWVVVSFLNAFLKPLGVPIDSVPVPGELWTLVTVGLGGYYTKESVNAYGQNKVEKAKAENTAVIDEDKLAAALRKNLFKDGMTDAQWKAIVTSAKESVE